MVIEKSAKNLIPECFNGPEKTAKRIGSWLDDFDKNDLKVKYINAGITTTGRFISTTADNAIMTRGFDDVPMEDVKEFIVAQSALLSKQLTQIKDRRGRLRRVAPATMEENLRKLGVIIRNGVRSPTPESFDLFIVTMNKKAADKGLKPMIESSMAAYYQVFKHWANARGDTSMPNRVFNTEDRIIMPPTREDVQKMILAAKNTRDRAIVAFVMGTGCRRKEIRNVKCSDIITDEEGTKILVRSPKNRKDRFVPVLGMAIPYINSWLAIRERYLANHKMADPDYLFITKDGKQMSKDLVYKTMSNVRKSAGVRYRGAVHGGRRFCLTAYGEAGVDIGMVKEIAGHSNIETTLRYQRYNTKQKMAAAKKVRGIW
jgi:integrase